MSKEHPLCQHTQQYGISGKLQEIVCLLAQSHVFDEGVMDKINGITSRHRK